MWFDAFSLREPESTSLENALMCPRLSAPKGKIIGIGGLPPRRLLRLEHLIGNALALAIGHGLLLGIEAETELLFHVAGRGPAHQRLDHAGRLVFTIELPILGFSGRRWYC